MIMTDRRYLLQGSISLGALALLDGRSLMAREYASKIDHVAPRIRAWEMGEGELGLRLVERPEPVPGPGEVLLKVHATGFNARDLSLLRGVRIYGGNHVPTRIPLDDNAGEVLKLGPGVTRVRPGDRVVCTHFPLWVDGAWDDESMSTYDFSVTTDGFLAERAVVPAQGLVRLPDNISYLEASTLPNAGLTAWHAVVVGAGLRPSETLMTLGSGGVSVFGMQWAKMLGARVVISSSSDEKLARLRRLGADLTINYRQQPDWHTEVLRVTGGRGADVVLNTVGISEMERCLLACASNGRVMLIGANSVRGGDSGVTPSGDEFEGLRRFPRGMIMKGLTIKGVIVGSRRMLENAVHAMAVTGIRPVIDRVFEFDDARAAMRYAESGQKLGKVVIRVP